MTVTWMWVRATARRGLLSLLFVGVVAGIGTAVVATALLGASRTRSAVDRAVASSDPPDLQVQSEGPGLEADLAGLEGVRATAPVAMYLGQVEGLEADFSLSVSGPAVGPDLNRVELQHGRLPDQESADEALLTPAMAGDLGVAVGESFEFQSISPQQLEAFMSEEGPGDEELPPGPVITMRVVGIGETLVDRLNSDFGGTTVSEAFSAEYAEEVGHFGSPGGLGEIVQVWLEDRDGREGFVEQAVAVRDDLSLFPLSELVGPAQRTTDVLASGVTVFALAAAVALVAALAALVIRHLARSRQDRATLAILGASDSHLLRLRVGETLPAGVFAAVVAVIGSVALASLTPFGSVARDLDPSRGASPPTQVLALVAIAAFALVAALTALLAVLTRLTERRAARVRQAAVWDRTTPPALATGVRFALSRGSGQQAPPTRTVLAVVVLAVVGVVAAGTFAGNLDELDRSPSRWGWTWSVKLNAYADQREQAAGLADQPSVAGVAFVQEAAVRLGDVDGRAQSWEALAGSLGPSIVAGRAPASPDEGVVSTSLATDLGVGVGDELTLSTRDGSTELSIVGEAVIYPLEGDALAVPSVLVTAEGMGRVALGDSTWYAMVRAVDGVTAESLYADLAEMMGDDITPAAYALADAPIEVDNTLQLRPVALLLAAFFGTVGAAVVGSGVTVSALRRRGELAVLRALGFRPRGSAAVIAWQAVATSVAALILGVPVGVVLGRVVSARVSGAAHVSPGSILQPLIVPAVAALTVGVALLLAVWPAYRAARASVAATLRTE